MANNLSLSTAAVKKMFPISFDRTEKHDRVLSESNLTDWIRGIVPNPLDTTENAKHSFVISMDNGYGTSSTGTHYLEFMLHGYYVKLSDAWLKDTGFKDILEGTNIDKEMTVVAKICLTDDSTEEFRMLLGEESREKFTALGLEIWEGSTLLHTTSDLNKDNCYKLTILQKPAGSSSLVIPDNSKSVLEIIDGGEIE